MVLSKKIIFEIEWQLKRYKQLKEIVEDEKMDIILSSNKNFDNFYSKTGGIYTDETGSKAIKICNSVSNEEKWVRIIEQAVNFFAGTGIDLFIVKKYFEKKSFEEVRKELNIERTTFYKWRQDIITYICLKAIQENLIRF